MTPQGYRKHPERDAKILADAHMSYSQLSKKYGLSISRIGFIVRRGGKGRNPEPKGARLGPWLVKR